MRMIDVDKLIKEIQLKNFSEQAKIMGVEYNEEMDGFYIGFTEELVREQPTVGEWIPCKEKFPEKSGTYIVSAIDGHVIRVSFAKWMPRLKTWALSGCRSYWKVIAWKPLPEPYQPEGVEQ